MGEQQESTTLWLGNLDLRVTRRLLYEIGIQAGPVVSVTLPVEGGRSRGYGFVEYEDAESAAYAVQLFRGNLRLFDRALRVDFGGQKGGASRGASAGLQQQQQQQQQQQANGGTPATFDVDASRVHQHQQHQQHQQQQPPLPPDQLQYHSQPQQGSAYAGTLQQAAAVQQQVLQLQQQAAYAGLLQHQQAAAQQQAAMLAQTYQQQQQQQQMAAVYGHGMAAAVPSPGQQYPSPGGYAVPAPGQHYQQQQR